MKSGTPLQCTKTKADGSRCQATARTGSTFCFFHDPEVAAERTAARKAGGIERSRRAAVLPADSPIRSLTTADDVVALLGETINQTRTGTLDPKIANTVGYLAGILLKALNQGDLEQRLTELEAVVRTRQDEPGSVFQADFRADHEGLLSTGTARS